MRRYNNSSSSSNSGNYRNPCITMHQPWASLLVYGIKRIEGRSWPSPIKGRLWIHAAGKVPDESTIKAMECFYKEIYALNGITDINFPQHYPVSRLLGCVEVVGCLNREEISCWEMVPESVRLEALTDYCWLCEQPQKLLIPFEMRGYQGVYNLERKIYEAAVRGLAPVDSPLPVKFPLPDPSDPFSLKPGRVSALTRNLKATEVDKSSSLSLAIAGACAAATQFSKKDHNSQSADRNNKPAKTDANHDEIQAARSYNLRPHPRSMEKGNIPSDELNEKFDDGDVSTDHEVKNSSKMNDESSSHHQSPRSDRRQHFMPSTKVSSQDDGDVSSDHEVKSSSKMNEGSSSLHQSPRSDRRQHFMPSTKVSSQFDDDDVSSDHEVKSSSKMNEGSSSLHQFPRADRRQHFQPATDSRHHFQPATDSRHHFQPATDKRHHFQPATDSRQHFQLATDRRQHFQPATDRRQHFQPATDRRQHFQLATDKRQHFQPVTDRRQYFQPATDRRQHFQPSTKGILVYRPKISSDKYERSSMHGQSSCAEADLRQHPHPPSKR
ncbi:putative PUA-like domain-containing protein [Medicago truncatula]|uniref:Putative PUA-like domain-containing protein n=1 Tax=Medicago truncatula TaxID=3880 RepID=A0A396JQQ3_MEDTR|nr:putative PUA-like domain-containing protein [Medicago truncatula]